MKATNYTFVLICLMMTNLSFSQQQPVKGKAMLPPPVITCADFEPGHGQDNYHAGWFGQNTTATIGSPSRDGDSFRKASAGNGNTYLYNYLYPENMMEYEGKCICFDYKLIDDGVSGSSVDVHPTIIFTDQSDPQSSYVLAKFVTDVTVTENSDWVRICAPIKPSDNGGLPSNSEGEWTNVTPGEWDALLNDLGSVAFPVNVGGAASEGATIGVDNVCIKKCPMVIVDPDIGVVEPLDPDIRPNNNKGAYCCDGDNLVKNGNFEAGNSSFSSSYTHHNSLYPGAYDVTGSASAFNATITDHSYCANPSQYSSNNTFMVVNGKTQQSGNSVVWEQEISGLKPEVEYKFCAKFKNMPQCTFDILPSVNVEISGAGSTGFSNIAADASDPCDWENKEFSFTASSTSVTVSIVLDETGNGDGNDVAIDDISVTRLMDSELDITVQHQGNPQQVTASINTIYSSDDVLPGGDECDYDWFVAEVDSYSPLTYDPLTLVYGNSSGNSTGYNSSAWNLTTTLPDYNFNQNTLYIVGMYKPACGCYGEEFTYQLTANSRLLNQETMSEEQKQQIIDFISNGGQSVMEGEQDNNLKTENDMISIDQVLDVYPNPTKGEFNLYLQGDTLNSVQIYSLTGQSVYTQNYDGERTKDQIDISSFASGFYLVKALGADGKEYSAKIVKQ